MHNFFIFGFLLICLSLNAMQLENGDIICFQKSLAMDCKKRFPFPDVTSYLKFVHIYEVLFLTFN